MLGSCISRALFETFILEDRNAVWLLLVVFRESSLRATMVKQRQSTVKTYSRKIPVTRIEDHRESPVFPQLCRSNPFSDEEDQLIPSGKKKQLVAEPQSHSCQHKCSVETLQTPSKDRLCGDQEGPKQHERSSSHDSDTKSICGPLPVIKGKRITHASWKLAGLLGKKKWPLFFQKTRTGTPVAAGKHQQWIKRPKSEERNQEDPENMSLGDDSVFVREGEHLEEEDSSEDISSEESDTSESESESESDSQSDTEVLRETESDAITAELQQFKIKSQLSPDWPGKQKSADLSKTAPTEVQGKPFPKVHQGRKNRQKSIAETSRPFTSYEDDSLEELETSSQSSFDSDSSSLRSILKTRSKTAKTDCSVKDSSDSGERKQVSFSPEVQVSQIIKNTTHPSHRSPLAIKSCTTTDSVRPSLVCQKMMLQKAQRKAGVNKTSKITQPRQSDPGEDGGKEGRQSQQESRATQSFNSTLLVSQNPGDSSSDEETDWEILREATSTQAESQPVAAGVPVIKRHEGYLQLNSTLVDNALACSILKLASPGVSPIADVAHTTKAIVPEVSPQYVQTQPRIQTEGTKQKHSVEKSGLLKPNKTGEENLKETFPDEDQDVRKRKSEAHPPSQSGLRSHLSGSTQGSGSKRVRFSADLSVSTNNSRNTNASLLVKSVRSSSETQKSTSNTRKKVPATPHHSTSRVRQRVSTAKSSRRGRNVTLQTSKDLSTINPPTYDESDLVINTSLPGATVNSQEIAPDSLSFEQQNKTSGSVKKGRHKGRKSATKACSARKTTTPKAQASAKRLRHQFVPEAFPQCCVEQQEFYSDQTAAVLMAVRGDSSDEMDAEEEFLKDLPYTTKTGTVLMKTHQIQPW
ncbi:PREDICTED: uncharacterized protein LOC109488207 isoform X4 [Branchiostoma belcheri]|uniref:Uncharacterized protein LOC109488207 isoform X4 n=1 Tax=Branchiostoma belcheri TaxID=7741 RepID=A0A6P5AP87_BRABE|nr:PREDICTED: uncharacterized protein LOC109488207 isoform X4 [Branchiostoma belcheri]